MNNKFSLFYSSSFELKLKGICKRNKGYCRRIEEKILFIRKEPQAGKPLGNIPGDTRRIHAGHNVIIYETDYENRNIILININHYDRVYTKK